MRFWACGLDVTHSKLFFRQRCSQVNLCVSLDEVTSISCKHSTTMDIFRRLRSLVNEAAERRQPKTIELRVSTSCCVFTAQQSINMLELSLVCKAFINSRTWKPCSISGKHTSIRSIICCFCSVTRYKAARNVLLLLGKATPLQGSQLLLLLHWLQQERCFLPTLKHSAPMAAATLAVCRQRLLAAWKWPRANQLYQVETFIKAAPCW